MRIALAGTLVGRGGIQTHLLHLSHALADSGHDVTVLSLDRPPPPNSSGSSQPDGRIVVHHLYPTQASRLERWRATAMATTVLKRVKPDVYVACGTGWNLFVPPLLAAGDCRTVFHEVMSGESNGLSDTRWVVRFAFDDVVAQASAVASNFRRSFHWPRPVVVLPAFSQPLEHGAGPGFPAARSVALGRARAAIFGRLVPHKRAFWLVQQWEQLSRSIAELHVFGEGPELTLIRAWISEKGLERRIVCHGAYPTGQAYVDLLRAMDMTLLPTVGAEGAPLVLLESMACGVPFVSTDAGGIRDYENDDCIVVPSHDNEAFVRGVSEMADRLEAGSVSAARLRGFYTERFSFDAIRRQWVGWLNDLAASETVAC